jgi:hypothetical protein
LAAAAAPAADCADFEALAATFLPSAPGAAGLGSALIFIILFCAALDLEDKNSRANGSHHYLRKTRKIIEKSPLPVGRGGGAQQQQQPNPEADTQQQQQLRRGGKRNHTEDIWFFLLAIYDSK